MAQTIQRRILPVLKQHLNAPEMTLLIGPRQVGKTTLIRTLLRGLEASGSRTVFFNLDIEEDMHWFGSQRLLLDRLAFLVGKTTERVYVAIDEIQRKQDAGRFMKGLYDMGLPYKFILSGSGSLELKEQIAESMMGRKQEFFIAPVSFAEFVDHRTDYAFSDRLAIYGQMEPQRLAGHFAYSGDRDRPFRSIVTGCAACKSCAAHIVGSGLRIAPKSGHRLAGFGCFGCLGCLGCSKRGSSSISL